MSAAKHILLEYCLLIAFNKHDESCDFLEQKLVKTFPESFTGMDELKEAANSCSQKTCIVLTNDNVWLKNVLKQEYDKIQLGTFFIVSTDHTGFEATGRLMKLVDNIIQPANQTTSLKDALKFLRKGKKQQEKVVKAFLKRKLQKKIAPELANSAFLEKLNKLFKLHYSNSDLRTTFLAEKMGISQSTLERKCLKITQKKPNQLLLEYRLAVAYKLSTQTLIPFSRIAQQCGFGSASYFSVRFTDFFRVKPSQARMQARLKAS
jgi:AraC-like DNA-binding protein